MVDGEAFFFDNRRDVNREAFGAPGEVGISREGKVGGVAGVVGAC